MIPPDVLEPLPVLDDALQDAEPDRHRAIFVRSDNVNEDVATPAVLRLRLGEGVMEIGCVLELNRLLH